ncbi:MAG: DUF4846 domain-containing protein [Myxococcota bacterium]
MLLLALAACAAPVPPADLPPPPPAPAPVAQEGSRDRAVLTEAFPPPSGSERVPTEGFGQWLRERTVAPADQPVKTHAGKVVGHRARVVELPMVRGDLQQCADSAIRLRAEWLKERGEPVMFHATSGDPMAWERWQAGERPYEQGGRLKWKAGTEGGWDAYLSKVFLWAGTLSLHAYDTEPAKGPPVPGDLLVDPGSPGHAVVLLDVARSDDTTYVLVGEGFMPAQDFHVELGPAQGWWVWDDGVALPHWTMTADTLRRFKP